MERTETAWFSKQLALLVRLKAREKSRAMELSMHILVSGWSFPAHSTRYAQGYAARLEPNQGFGSRIPAVPLDESAHARMQDLEPGALMVQIRLPLTFGADATRCCVKSEGGSFSVSKQGERYKVCGKSSAGIVQSRCTLDAPLDDPPAEANTLIRREGRAL